MSPVWVLATFFALVGAGKLQNKVLVVSFDGFRWDYPRMYRASFFNQLIQKGVSCPNGMVPPFVTKTFPCHHTLSTGLWQESHGIIDNNMYDPVTNKSFRMTNIGAEWWNDSTPIWISARLQGLKTGVYFWPGSEVKLRGTFPNFYVRYDNRKPYKVRVDTMVEWLEKMDIDFGMMYFNEPDHTAHEHGAGSEKVKEAVEYTDQILRYLIDSLRKAGLFDQMNILIVSDHGMTNRIEGREHLIVLNDYINVDKDTYRVPSSGPLAGIVPNYGKSEMIYQKLKNAHRNMTVYKKEDLPERFHYKNHRRIPDILAIADEGYVIAVKTRNSSILGQHGYDNALQSMRTIFIATGPAFKKNFVLPSFDMVNVYPLLCHLLNIQPEPNNGSLDVLRSSLLKEWTMFAAQPVPVGGAPSIFAVTFLLSVLSILSWLYKDISRQCI